MNPKYITVGMITSLLLCYVYDLMTKKPTKFAETLFEFNEEQTKE